MAAVDEYESVIEAIYDYAEAQGIEIETIIQEGGAGQLEINVGHGDPVALADQVFFFKRSIREAALQNGCFATFMAKPMQDEPGSAMHIHQSVLDTRTGRTVFADEAGQPTPLFHGFLAGQQDNLPSLISLLAPYVNSYRRYTTEDAAPINLEWGRDNRSTGLRIPLSTPEALRVENRVAGMDCNCYLAFAASLAAGYIGMKSGGRPRPEVAGDAYELPRAIPRSLHEALDLLKNNRDVVEVLGEEFCTVYLAIKRQEVEEFLQVISPWEREHLLLNV
jgi:glutamine synthetase